MGQIRSKILLINDFLSLGSPNMLRELQAAVSLHAAAEAEIDRILLGNGYRRRYRGLSETDAWYAR